MQSPRPLPGDRSDDRRTAIGRFLNWLTPEGPRDDWLEPDRDSAPGDCTAECPEPAEGDGPESGGCPHR